MTSIVRHKSGALAHSAKSEIDAFFEAASCVPAAPNSGRGRLIFALDATASRGPTWNAAREIQGMMFETATRYGSLEIQLAFYRGTECKAFSFVNDGPRLAALMSKIEVQAGQTQIGKILQHTIDETIRQPVGTLIFIGDCMEENPDRLAGLASELGMLGVRAFMFHEGKDKTAEWVFRDIARLTGGAFAAFNSTAPETLAELLSAVAAYAAGGLEALEHHASKEAMKLLKAIAKD
jgi:hypothetical protein